MPNCNKLVKWTMVSTLLAVLLAMVSCTSLSPSPTPIIEEGGNFRVDFTATPTEGNASLTVQFTDQSEASVTDYWWFFGDGQSSREKNPSHIYSHDGSYTVTLVAFKGNHRETKTKENYIRTGNPVPAPVSRLQEDGVENIELPPRDEFVALDLAGQGAVYWTRFIVSDKAKASWAVTEQYEHSIWVDGAECFDTLNRVKEIWDFQGQGYGYPDGLYPGVYVYGPPAEPGRAPIQACGFWRLNIPFHDSLALIVKNNDPKGTITVRLFAIIYDIVSSGMPEWGKNPRGYSWVIEEINDDIGFPVAPKIKAALEKEFGERVISVAILHRQAVETKERYKMLHVDAPGIERAKIRCFLKKQGLMRLEQKAGRFESIDFTATPTEGSVPLTVQFTDQSIGEITHWWWLFGDGQSSTEQNPSHTYTDDGVYTVTLMIVTGPTTPHIETKVNYIRAGEPAPSPILRYQQDYNNEIDIPPETEFVALDIAGEGTSYWTWFRVFDKAESSWAVTKEYQHSLYIDGIEHQGNLNQVAEIWNSQHHEIRCPEGLSPTIYEQSNSSADVFWQVNTPFHNSLALVLRNKDPQGTVHLKFSTTAYDIVASGIAGAGGEPRGQLFGINKVNEGIAFPAAPKIKAALEKEFGKKVYSVVILLHKQIPETGKLVFWFYVDAPGIKRDEIKNFLERRFVEFE